MRIRLSSGLSIARVCALPRAQEALAYIRLLYDVENQAKESVQASGIDPGSEAQRFHDQLLPDRWQPAAPSN